MNLSCQVHLAFGLVFVTLFAVGLSEEGVSDVVGGIHLLGMMKIQQCGARIVAMQQNFAHLNERAGTGDIQ